MNTTDTKHTPGPWVRDSEHGGPMVGIEAQADMLREDIGTDREWEAIGICDEEGFSAVVALAHPDNAGFIVRAVNNHDALVNCAMAYLSRLRSLPEDERVRSRELIELVETTIKNARAT